MSEQKVEGITVVSPMWGDRTVTDRMVLSVLHQYISKDNPFNIELILVDDYIEGRGENDQSAYDRYLSEEFQKEFMPSEHLSIKLIKNKGHKYQGESREIGFTAGTYDWFLLVDCDDMLSPNACDRYKNVVEDFYRDQEQLEENERKELACVNGFTYGFSTHGGESKIPGHSIWVQGRLYNRQFIFENDVHFPTGLNSRQGEDYPFIRKLDYAINHDEKYISVKIPYEEGQDCQCTVFWFPNEQSLSRKDPHYGQHLSGWTMASSNSIFEYFTAYNKKHGLIDQEDEGMKQECLNMNIYAFYNLLDFIREVAMTDYEPLQEDWIELRNNVKELRRKLKDMYWEEIVYSNVEDVLYNVHHHSDVRFTESWLGTFYDYMNDFKRFSVSIPDGKKSVWLLDMTYDEMVKYSKSLEFDGVGHEIHSRQVQAWVARHRE